MADNVVHTLGDYLNGSCDFFGREFGGVGSTYEILRFWSEISSRDVYGEIRECDLDNMGHTSSFDRKLSGDGRLMGMEELVEGINAERVVCAALYSSSI